MESALEESPRLMSPWSCFLGVPNFTVRDILNDVKNDQTWNLSQVAQEALVFLAGVKLSRINAENDQLCKICQIQARVFTKELE